MDYDGNDTQAHNLQLAGEGRSKSSSVLRPYAFPRFDFDDSLQGHLRFDGLVETEVFLGIQSQEDNQWIEDFSRGSSVIEYSSSGTESCPITRRKNVWSEATSSESVEMLLKSVGQEQILPKETVTENSNTCNELGDLTNKMERKFEQDNIDGGYKRIADATMPQDELLNNFSGLENHVEGKLSQNEEISSSQAHLVQEHESSSQMCSKVLEKECTVPVAEGGLLLGTECDDKSKQGAECPIHESVDRAGLSHTPVPASNINSSSRVLGSSQSLDKASSHGIEGSDDLIRVASGGIKGQLASEEMTDADTHIMEQNKVEDAMHSEDVSHSFSLREKSVGKGAAVEVVINSNESSAMSCVQESQYQLQKGRGRGNLTSPTLLGKCQTDVLPNSRVIGAALTGSDLELHAAKLEILNAEHHSSSERKFDSALQLDHKLSADKVDNVSGSSHKGGEGDDVSGGLSQSSLIKGEDGELLNKINKANIADVGAPLGFSESSSAELTRETGGAESMKGICDASIVNVEESRSFDGSREDFEQEAGIHASNAHKSKHTSVEAKKEDGTWLCTDVDLGSVTGVALTSDQRVESSAKTTKISHDNTIAYQSHPEIASGMKSETNVLPFNGNSDPVGKGNNDNMHKESFAGESSHVSEKEESVTKMSVDVILSNLDVSDQLAAEVGSACEDKFGMRDDSIASQLSDADGKQIQLVETCNNASGSEAQTVNSSDCSKGLEAHLGSDDLLLNKGDAVEGFSSAADAEKVACNSPTIISSSALTPDERKQEGVRASVFSENKPSTSEDLKVKDISGDDNSFTFKVNSLPDVEREKANKWAPFPTAETYMSSKVLEGVPTVDVDKIQDRLSRETSGQSPGEHAQGISKSTSGRRRRVSGKGAAKENPQKVVTPDKPSRRGDRLLGVSLSPGSGLPGQFAGLQPHGLTEQKSKKQSTRTAVPTSSLPDLNASALKNPASPSKRFQQPFSDLQQVQLRAQIFVYGSLIQGTAPDETFMASAFGSPDRGRGVWEPVWKAAIERVRSKKSHSSGESAVISHSTGTKVPEVAGKQVTPQSKVFQSPVCQAGSKGTLATVSNPVIPPSSPLWSISTRYHDGSQPSNLPRRPVLDYQPAVSTLHPYQTTPLRNIIGHTTWPSQAPGSPTPWASQSAALNSRFSTIPLTESVKLTLAKDFSLPAPSCAKDAQTTPLISVSGPSSVLAGCSQQPDQTKGTLSSELASADPKPRRKKKAQASNSIPQNPLLSQAQTEQIVASSLTTPTPLVPVTIPTCHVTTSTTVGGLDVGVASASSEDTLQKVADAKLHAEEAAVLAATAIRHCEGLWCQLAKQDSGMTQEAEVKIAAAAGAAAAAAAASVAKAAAAAARVASNASLQAKLMADEALVPSRMGDGSQSGNLVSNVLSAGRTKPASILTGDGGSNQSNPILVAAREAAKRRIEAASAAAKQAENLDAILKAAELAAEAVSQAGKIVAMGDPLPLKELINAGPEGYWKLPQASSKLVLKSGDGNREQNNIGSAEGAEISTEEYVGPSGVKGSKNLDHGKKPLGELSNDPFGDNARNAYGISESIGVDENDSGAGKSHKVSDMVQSDRGLPALGNISGSGSVLDEHKELGMVQGNNIKEGSVVEVYKDGDGLKPAWFSAKVLTLHDGKAFVHYTSLLSKEGSDNLKEWVALEGEGGKAPRIRAALLMTASHWQVTRKRRRSGMENFPWTIGDMVDVCIQDSWWEGVVTDKNEKDDSTLTVHFPARGETSAVSAQQLRPSRIWSNGTWVEWSRLRGNERSNESDMRLEKRPRLISSKSDKEKSKFVDDAEPHAGKPEESKLLALSASDNVFNVGKSTKAETKPDARQKLKTGLQKEGSRVVFGVPKPGKKRKFMEVSKHFSIDQNKKDNESKYHVKFAKYLMPQGTASRGWKNQSKVDSKEKQALKVTTSRKSRSASSGTVPQMDDLAQHDEANTLSRIVKKSDVHGENIQKTAALADQGFSSGTDESTEEPLSSLFASHSDGSLKKSSSTNSELTSKGKVVPSGGQLTKIDEEKVYNNKTDKALAEVSEPRRSNRRIQPTHRLLEGLQSSLTIPKMSSVSHDKGQSHKSRGRSAVTRGK